ncbi:type II toxin-antitoxin system HicB family antitoxin [Komagataeibacter saccharivorans]|uniref:HicB family protein n=1 Tax=Komagataeibacter saccharivorans TaxID=265959 RepID=A0A347WDB0_9PROT|nr:type II toxin-antitoxin system HicB family antitoxin [Komagataeibacter saccharivorans]AXY22853.1 HicB family protein [Komagataeibacter saccharivorans]
MNNMMEIGSHRAVIQFDPEIGMFRGEFLGLNGGADFYADSVEGLRTEGEISLRVFLDMCEAKGIAPTKRYSGKFQVRLSPDVHARAAEIAAARGVSLNRLVQDALELVER